MLFCQGFLAFILEAIKHVQPFSLRIILRIGCIFLIGWPPLVTNLVISPLLDFLDCDGKSGMILIHCTLHVLMNSVICELGFGEMVSISNLLIESLICTLSEICAKKLFKKNVQNFQLEELREIIIV